MINHDCNNEQRDAFACWIRSIQDNKSLALEQIEALKPILEANGYEIKQKPKTFTKSDAERVNAKMKEVAEKFDSVTDMQPSFGRLFSRDAEQVTKNLIILVLKKRGYVDKAGKPMETKSFCDILSTEDNHWNRNTVLKRFRNSTDVENCDAEGKKGRLYYDTIKEAYKEISKNI